MTMVSTYVNYTVYISEDVQLELSIHPDQIFVPLFF